MAQVHLTTKSRRARGGRCSSKSCATEPVKNSSKPPGTASIMETNAAGAVGAEAEEDDVAAGRFIATCTAGTSDADEPAEVAAVGAEAVADIDAAGRFITLLAGVTKCRVVSSRPLTGPTDRSDMGVRLPSCGRQKLRSQMSLMSVREVAIH